MADVEFSPREQWRAIPGFEGSYEVSDQGRVRSLARVIYRHMPNGALWPKTIPERILRPGLTSVGYPSVVLGRSGGTYLVHALVLLAFVGPCPSGQEVRHLDGTRDNAELENLAYGPRSVNNHDRVWHGRYKLTARQVLEIYRAEDETCSTLAKRYKINRTSIHRIRNGKTHAHITGHVSCT